VPRQRVGSDDRVRVMRVIARLNVGGPALQVAGLVQLMDPARFDHRLFAGEVGAGEADFVALRAPDLPFHRVRGLGRSPNALGDVRALTTLIAEMRRFRPDIVHTHTAKAGTLGRIAARVVGVPNVVHTYHGHLLHGYFSPRVTTAVVQVERLMARRTNRLIAVGSKVRDELLAAGVGHADQYRVVPPGIPLGPLPNQHEARRLLGLPSDELVVMLIARLVPIKRVDRFIEIATNVTERHSGVTFAIAGDGPLIRDLRTAAGHLGSRMRFLGWRPDVEVVHAASDVALLCSDNEGMPVSLIEAALAGVPAVTTRVGSAAEVVIHGKTGFVTDVSVSALSAAVGQLVSDADLRLQMGRAARRHAGTSFSQARLVEDTQRLYEEMIGNS
jgi:glycosyltransferase involved in cell wall biosynthesis